MLISPAFSSENGLGFRGNDILPRVVVPLHLVTGFRYLSADRQLPSESHDEDFSKLDGKGTKEGKDFRDGYEAGISYRAEPESSQSKTVPLLFEETIGLDKMLEDKTLELKIKGLSDLSAEEQVIKLKSMLESQRRLFNIVKDNIDDLDNTLTEFNNKNALPENAKNQIAQILLQFKRSVSGKIDSVTEELSIPKESVKSEQKKKSVKNKECVKNEKNMPIMKKKAEGDLGSLEHLWPEWVQFVEHLNERGYLSKAVDFEDAPVYLQGHTTTELYGFIRLAAISFAKDNAGMSELLSRSDLRKFALFYCPSLETSVIAALRRLRSFISSEEDIYCALSDLEDTRNTPSVKQLRLTDVVRLLCAYGLDAEKNEVPIPDDVRQSVVNLLEEIVDLSTYQLCER